VRLAAAAALSLLAFALPAAAGASEEHPTQSELEAYLICPTCHSTLDQSSSPVAQQMKSYIRKRIAEGATKSEIVDEFVGPPNNMGRAVIGVPGTSGFDLLAWLLPIAGIAIGAVALGGGAYYWSRSRSSDGGLTPAAAGPKLDPELERRVDEELARFDG
jgi:cytochrome c-type biogenesis protein CcmH/NrfF